MSLIIDALKKAQQLRSKESKGSPFFRGHTPGRKDRKRGPWFILVFALSSLIVLVVIWKFFLTSSPLPPVPTVKIAEKPPAPTVVEKVSPETRKEEVKPVEESKISQLSASPSPLKETVSREKTLPDPKKESIDFPPKPTPEEKIVRPPKQEEKADTELKPAQEKPSPPLPPKEERISKPVALEQGTGRDRHLTTEVIHHFNSGITHHNQGEMTKAIQAYQKVIELDPNHIEAHNNLGIIYQETGNLESALKAYQKAIEVNPRYEKALNNMGIIFHLKGEDEKAMEAYKKVLSINPNHIESHIHLGTLYKRKGQTEKGIESYQKALAIDPLHGETHYNLGLLYEQAGNRGLAVQHYRQFIESSSNAYPELASRVRRHIQQLLKTEEVKKE